MPAEDEELPDLLGHCNVDHDCQLGIVHGTLLRLHGASLTKHVFTCGDPHSLEHTAAELAEVLPLGLLSKHQWLWLLFVLR